MDFKNSEEHVDFIKQRRMQQSTPSLQKQSSSNCPFQKNFLKTFQSKYTEEEIKEYRRKVEIVVKSDHTSVPAPFQNWSDYSFPSYIVDPLEKQKFDLPTAIQSQAIPIIMQGNDFIGVAQTGSGKTLAFLIPGIVHLKAQPKSTKGEGPIMLVLAPTRELAMQIHGQVDKFGLESACLYGGVEKRQQEFKLVRGIDVIIATPGRMIDFLDQGRTHLNRTTYLVLDEADKMLDMGFEPQVRRIVDRIRPDRQTILFSATWPPGVQQMANEFCQRDAHQIQIGFTANSINKDIKQTIIILEHQDEKYEDKRILGILDSLGKDNKVLIFTQTKRECDDLSYKLNKAEYYTLALHGDKSQQERDYVMNELRMSRVKIVVATDVAQRGLDVRDITHVINYDFPKVIEDYIHRIGRTGRAGDQGESISFLVQGEEDPRLIDQLISVMKRGEQKINDELFDYGQKRKSRYPKATRPGKSYNNHKQPEDGQFPRKAQTGGSGQSFSRPVTSTYDNRGFQDRAWQGERRPPTEHTFEKRTFEPRQIEKQQSLSIQNSNPPPPLIIKQQSQNVEGQETTSEPKKGRFFNSKK